MDDQNIKNLLANVKAPPVDDNARKRAVNLALSEFEAAGKAQNQTNKTFFQGFISLARLTNTITQDNRRKDPMKKKHIYGGLATAMVVVLVAGVSFQQFSGEFAPDKVLDLGLIEQTGMVAVLDEETIAPAFIEAIKQQNEAEPNLARPRAGEKLKGLEQKQKNESGLDHMAALDYAFADGRAEPKKLLATPEMQKEQTISTKQNSRMLQEGIVGNTLMAGAPSGAVANLYSVTSDYDDSIQQGYKDIGRDKFEDFKENPIKLVSEESVSTFSIDVDTSSYSFMRRQINNGVLPQKDAVRIEEMINYFDYDYALPETKEEPFKPSVTVVPSPWAEGRKLVHIGIKGYDIAPTEKPHTNLVFLLDVSGSMNAPDKLPLLKNSFKLLLDTLEPDDTVGIVVYAGAAGTVLEPTKVSEKSKILNALENLSAGGSTAGAEGIRQAYQLAENNLTKDGVNRIILATDGDFNVGITNRDELKDFVERKRETGIFLSVLGFGQGNLNDHMMQTLAQNGNGVAAYIDTLSEARKVLVEEASSTLFPIAKDVKIQVEFNPDSVAEYRLIGYETRALNREDFNNDAVDAGDIGAGHTVTAIYEITPKGGPLTIDENRYEKTEEHKAKTDFSDEYAFLKIRYKNPNEDTSKLITTPITKANDVDSIDKADDDTRFATSVAAFGQLLKGGKYTASYSYGDVIDLAQSARGDDPFGYRTEFVNLVRLAKSSGTMEKSAPVLHKEHPMHR
ncbi:MAG: VWA domain-containing protein [Alphaproteobacteria bacterium]|nr:VWA domain-containing protein [Alphaproteobacteria bacterium]